MARWRISLPDDGQLAPFKAAARALIAVDAPPETIIFGRPEEAGLFGDTPPASGTPFDVPRAFVQLADLAVAHRDPERFALLYRLLWRLRHGERHLLEDKADPLIHRLQAMAKAVRRDMHKMTAFVRFRGVTVDDVEHYVAWFEPDHFILQRMQAFFRDRFAAHPWSILTPDGSLHWDGATIRLGPATPRSQAPKEDAQESFWQTYYRAMFNPARVNPTAMRSEMPQRYWRNLPEARLIPDLLRTASGRTDGMLAAAPVEESKPIPPPRFPAPPPTGTLEAVHAAARSCERCPLHAQATQTVCGEGPKDAPVVFVGEQPGDQEDLTGRPFVGPAGQLFDRAMQEAGLDRARIYVTNAVKHFKFVLRGKRRIHQKPDSGEVQACKWWLDQELDLIRPRLTVAMGATAARALTGRAITIGRERGRPIAFSADRPGLITVHPSYLLRLPDKAAQREEYRRFVAELALVGQEVDSVRLPA